MSPQSEGAFDLEAPADAPVKCRLSDSLHPIIALEEIFLGLAALAGDIEAGRAALDVRWTGFFKAAVDR